jgi:transposase
MRYIQLIESEEETLQEALVNHSSNIVRVRSQTLLLSHRKYPVKELARLHQVRTRTIYEWFSRWQTQGIVGLRISEGRGRKATLQPSHIPVMLDSLLLDCQDLKQASVKLSEELAQPVSKGQIKRFLKS